MRPEKKSWKNGDPGAASDNICMGHSFRLRFHRRARHIKLKLLRDGSLEVVAPPGTSRHVIQCFVEANGDWVDQARERLPKRRSGGPESGPFPELLQLRALDERALVIWADGSASAYRWSQHGVRINLTQRDAGLAHELLVRALKARAVEHLEPRFHSLTGRFGKTVGRLTWRNQKTRWGSCSSNGNISLNIRLLFLPPELVDYVFAHELTHLEHPDHSPRFWSALEALWPGSSQHRRAMRSADRLLPDWI